MEGLIGILAIILGGIWLVAFVIVQIWHLIALFKADWVIALLSLIFAPLAIIILVKHWHEVKRPFLYNLALMVIGGIGFIGFILVQGAFATAQDPPPAIPELPEFNEPVGGGGPAEQPSDPEVIPGVEEIPATPIQPGTPTQPTASGTPTPIADKAIITIPSGWEPMTWELPHLGLAVGNTERGEFATVHLLPKSPGQTFEAFQEMAMTEVRHHLIKASEPIRADSKAIEAGPVVTYSMGGRGLLPDQAGKPMSARVSCVDGSLHFFYVIQWRTAAWDEESTKTFNRMLISIGELNQLEIPNP